MESIDTHSDVDKSKPAVFDSEDKDACTDDNFCWEQLKKDKTIIVSGSPSSDRYKEEYIA